MNTGDNKLSDNMEIVKEYLKVDMSPTASCRCCLLESSCSKLCTDYFWDGKRVVYTDLLMDTFGLTIISSSELNQAICEACVTRLIDATEFKKQVQECEATLYNSVTTNKLKTEQDDPGLKLEKVKEETIDIEDFVDDAITIDDDDNDDDSGLKLEKVVKEETIDIDDFVDDTITIDDDNDDEPLLEKILIKSETTGFKSKEEIIKKTVHKWPTLNKFNSMVTKKITVSSSNFKDKSGTPVSSSLKTSKNFVKKNILVPSSKLKDIAGMPTSSGLKSLKIGNKTVYVKVHSTKLSLMKQGTSKYNKVARSNKSNLSDANNELLGLKIPFRKELTVKKVLSNKSVKGTQPTMSIKKISTSQVHNDAVPETTRIKENSAQILLYTTAYPFRFPKPYFNVACVYCTKENIKPASYRAHIDTEHPKTINPRKAYRHIASSNILLKVECSDLKCRICNKSFSTLDTIANHLSEDHRKKIDFTTSLGLAPFKFIKNEVFTCAVCGKQFVHLNTLSKHTTTHYSRFMCDKCGKGYSCTSILRRHQRFGHVGKPICKRCESTFETREELNMHLENTAKCRPYVCNECGERFATDNQKRDHMIAIHGIKRRAYKCYICQKVFSSKKCYTLHLVNNHATEIGTKCEICDKKFLRQNEASQHMSMHTGATPYQCEQCGKAYPTRKSLMQHVRINHKYRYSCDECKKHFGCKSSLLNHNATHH